MSIRSVRARATTKASAAPKPCSSTITASGVEIKIARIFNTYGPRMSLDDGRVVSNFIVQALKGENITIYGDGAQTRSFCYVDDLVRGLIALMESPAEITGPVNLGNPVEFTMVQLASLVIEMTGSASDPGFSALAAGRSAPAPARYHQGAGPARLGAVPALARRSRKDHRPFQVDPRRTGSRTGLAALAKL